jgi:hypothetical protein
MDAARSRLVRSLVILGALLGVFGLHGLSLEQAEAAPVTQVVSAVAVDAHGVSERLERVAMSAPFTVAVDTSDHLVPCAALLMGSLLLMVWAGVVLPRRRFADGPLLPALRPFRRPAAASSPHLAKLCILRT